MAGFGLGAVIFAGVAAAAGQGGNALDTRDTRAENRFTMDARQGTSASSFEAWLQERGFSVAGGSAQALAASEGDGQPSSSEPLMLAQAPGCEGEEACEPAPRCQTESC